MQTRWCATCSWASSSLQTRPDVADSSRPVSLSVLWSGKDSGCDEA
jgi:hypothetical protein